MKISIIGTGYVGLVTGLCFAELGNNVTCVDVIPAKIDAIKNGHTPIFEPKLDKMLAKHISNGSFKATLDIEDIADTDMTFISVGTPSRADGSLDLRFIENAAADIGNVLARKNGYHVVVVKSTVTPTTTERLVRPILEKCSGRQAGADLGLAVNPEFLKEGMAVDDFMNPDRIVVGSIDKRSADLVLSLYSDFKCPKLILPLSTAEMVKVASNAFLATKISFINELGNICKDMGVDVRQVAEGMGLDKRIGPQFLKAGCGFGGSCFPKDVSGIVAEAKKRGLHPRLMEAALKVNKEQPDMLLRLLDKHMEVKGKKVAVLGLAFKPFTDDIREASSLIIIKGLISRGAEIRCHDPKAMDNFKKEYPDLNYCASPYECVNDADVIVIVTEWPEYQDPQSLWKYACDRWPRCYLYIEL